MGAGAMSIERLASEEARVNTWAILELKNKNADTNPHARWVSCAGGHDWVIKSDSETAHMGGTKNALCDCSVEVGATNETNRMLLVLNYECKGRCAAADVSSVIVTVYFLHDS